MGGASGRESVGSSSTRQAGAPGSDQRDLGGHSGFERRQQGSAGTWSTLLRKPSSLHSILPKPSSKKATVSAVISANPRTSQRTGSCLSTRSGPLMRLKTPCLTMLRTALHAKEAGYVEVESRRRGRNDDMRVAANARFHEIPLAGLRRPGVDLRHSPTLTQKGFDTEEWQTQVGGLWQPGEKALYRIEPASIMASVPIQKSAAQQDTEYFRFRILSKT